MYSIHTRDDLEKLKKLQETKSLLKAERLKENLGKQDFHYDLEEVFEPVTTKQVESNEKQLQVIDKQTQGVTQAIENQTRAIEHNSNTLRVAMQNSIKEGIKQYDEITNRNAELHNQLLTSLVNSNQVDSSIVKTVSNLLNDKNKSQFSLEPIEGYPHSSPNLFTINPHNPQPVLIKGSMMAFQNEHLYDLNDPDLQYFITNTQFDRELNNLDTIYNYLNDIKYDINYGDKKSTRYLFNKNLINQYTYQQSQLGSGLGEATHENTQIVFLPSDPDELVDQLKLLYFEILGGNDSFLINEQIIAIIDKLLEYECISPSQHQNIRSTITTYNV